MELMVLCFTLYNTGNSFRRRAYAVLWVVERSFRKLSSHGEGMSKLCKSAYMTGHEPNISAHESHLLQRRMLDESTVCIE